MNTTATPVQEDASNLTTYYIPEVISHYASLNYLTPCEQLLFRTYITTGMSVLDLGVGGGRTTASLSRVAEHYVGVDYSEAMIRACRRKFPNLNFVLADAADLSMFDDCSFDSVVFSFNGLDSIRPRAKREQCVRECCRVLRPRGIFVFSSHNPRSILFCAGWDRGRLRAFARKVVGHRRVLLPPLVALLTGAKAVQACIRASFGSVSRIIRRLPNAAFWRGECEMYDPVDGGLVLHYSTPGCVIAELMKSDFQLVDLLGDDHPRPSHPLMTDWYYYVFAKGDNQSMSRQSCA